MSRSSEELKNAKNIGPKIYERLSSVGIQSLRELKKIGATKAYLKIKKKHPNESIPRCYYLYSLEGALRKVDWRKLSPSTKKRLLESVVD